METSSLKKKKSGLKGKLKSILSRPDPVFWPMVSKEHEKTLETILSKYKVEIPVFIKPHWEELKSLPKNLRPKPPKLKKVNGLLFGMAECSSAVQNKKCSAVIIEGTVNPRIIVQAIVEACGTNEIPVVCLKDLKQFTATNFGIPTICLGIKSGMLTELTDTIYEIAKLIKPPKDKTVGNNVINIMDDHQNSKTQLENGTVRTITVQEIGSHKVQHNETKHNEDCPYLFRTDKKSRVFIPLTKETVPKETKNFTACHFVKVTNQHQKSHEKHYKSMILKRLKSNQNRKENKRLNKNKRT